MVSLAGRVALVTGAGSGIGRACALRLTAEGAAVAVADIRAAGARETAETIERHGGTALALTVDVGDEAAVAAMVAAVDAEFGRLDVLHNNAAILDADVYGRDLDLTEMDVEVWDRTMAVNLRGPMLGCKHAVPLMRRTAEHDGAAIVNTVSVSALLGDVDHAAYGSAKAAVMSLTRYVATMYGAAGIRCNAVAPALVLTEAAKTAMSPERLVEKAAERVLPHAAEPEDVAALVAFLASEEARCVTGQTILIDSGTTVHRPEHAMRTWARTAG